MWFVMRIIFLLMLSFMVLFFVFHRIIESIGIIQFVPAGLMVILLACIIWLMESPAKRKAKILNNSIRDKSNEYLKPLKRKVIFNKNVRSSDIVDDKIIRFYLDGNKI